MVLLIWQHFSGNDVTARASRYKKISIAESPQSARAVDSRSSQAQAFGIRKIETVSMIRANYSWSEEGGQVRILDFCFKLLPHCNLSAGLPVSSYARIFFKKVAEHLFNLFQSWLGSSLKT